MVDKAPFEIIPRSKWKPLESPRPMERLRAPATAVIWTNTLTKSCRTEEKCLTLITEIQLTHLKGGQFDIPFHFIIGPDGKIYEGRDWYWASTVPYTVDHIINMERPPHNNKGVIIAHIGKNIVTDPEEPMAKATQKIIDYGIELKIIKPDYETIVKPYWIRY